MTRPASARRWRLHLESRRAQPPGMHLHAQAWARAAERHAELAAQVEPSFGWDGETLAESVADADFLIASAFAKPVVNAAPRLAWIHTTGAGVDQFAPLAELREDLLLTNSSGIHGDRAREYALMALLMLHSGYPALAAAQREHRWQPRLAPSIRGRTLLAVGYGDVGQAIGAAALALGMRVLAVTRSGALAPGSAGADEVAALDRLDELLPRADVVALAAPLTPATRQVLDARRQALMADGACVLNMARAALLDHDALLARLRSGACGGAVLDVFDPEPLPAQSPLWDAPNLLVTPHVSCDVPDYAQRVLDRWFDNFARRLKGAPLGNIVDRARGY